MKKEIQKIKITAGGCLLNTSDGKYPKECKSCAAYMNFGLCAISIIKKGCPAIKNAEKEGRLLEELK